MRGMAGCGLQQGGGVLRGEGDQAIFITHQDVARLHQHAADADRHVDFPRAGLVGAAMHDVQGIAGGVCEAGDIANRTVDDEAGAASLQGIELDQFADHSVAGVALGVDDQHMPRLQHGHGLVDEQVVAGACLDR